MSLFEESPLTPWQQEPFHHLSRQLEQGHLPHSILVLGEEGVGREDFCQFIAQWMLCNAADKTQGYCGQCKGCQLFEAGSHPDYHLLEIEEGKTQIAISQVRELIQHMQESSHQAGWKLANITNIHALNESSFNALLKTLEEPQSNTLLLLQADQLQGVPATIKSRAQILKVGVADVSMTREWLKQRHDFFSQEMETAIQLFPTAPYKVEAFVENGEAFKSGEFIFDYAEVITAKQTPMEIADRWKDELENCIFWCQLMFHDVLLLQQSATKDDIQLKQQYEAIEMIASTVSAKGVMLLLNKIIEIQRLIKLKSPANLMASWQSFLIYSAQIAIKYKKLES
ncbi:DNA polymerase III subunit delta' C-terminal domain-containing protein [Kangiella sediminilitoris]|uniref:DNA polymerase III subunit delta' n=1 Tax=Kangiella sediminilitoris TaxID=1144748 RepID=A0A1B3BAJ1_9GAMM|nr:DNA polymerase III subunit delta' C-terminal domain-containing protein [Kangiella sediminilitoris]AOE49815.1 DNA-directed DNA polymerase [Kangiella sediminilitoris]